MHRAIRLKPHAVNRIEFVTEQFPVRKPDRSCTSSICAVRKIQFSATCKQRCFREPGVFRQREYFCDLSIGLAGEESSTAIPVFKTDFSIPKDEITYLIRRGGDGIMGQICPVPADKLRFILPDRPPLRIGAPDRRIAAALRHVRPEAERLHSVLGHPPRRSTSRRMLQVPYG